MAQQVRTLFVDDLDGTEAAETIVFAYRGKSYEIDVNDTHAKAFDESLAEWIDAARQVKAIGKVVRRADSRPAVADREQNQAIREWANANGFTVSARGRIRASVVEAFQAAH